MDTYTLVIIDMQPKFSTARHERLNRHVEIQIKKAISLDLHIVFVRYVDFGLTNKNLTALTRGYTKVHHVIKDEDDGSDNLEQRFRRKKIPSGRLVICGVNTDCCVASTVLGLCCDRNRKIVIPIKACNSSSGKYIKSKNDMPRGYGNPFHRVKSLKQVKLV